MAQLKDVRTINGYYGSSSHPCEIYTVDGWYCIEGSVNVNHTDEDLLVDGVNIEYLPDYDFFMAGSPIESEEDLLNAIDD